ncbi:cellulase family glycosylhydrolase [Glutamicibacter uratoxydans]|uniref:cellulase family glycosylhydrolase n=1 Tax=Glutamicibacter uratoxydans TaxID=43667 RepID=UPI003D701C0D
MGEPYLKSKWTSFAVVLLTCSLIAGCSSSNTEADHIDSYEEESFTRSSTTPTPGAEQFFSQKFNSHPKRPAVNITIENDASGTTLSDDNIGLSFEAVELTDPRWDPDFGNLDETLQRLGSPGLRFGGNSLDRQVFWSSTGEEAPQGKTLITPEDFKKVMKTVQLLDAKVTIGIPLGDFAPERGADMAKHASKIFGDNLIGISIGNEPNGYTAQHRPGLQIRKSDDWGTAEYVKQVEAYAEEIRAVVGNETPLIGPGVFDGSWMTAFLDAEIPNTAALTQHYYATYDCTATDVPSRGPEWQNLLDPIVENSSKKMLGIGLSKAQAENLPLWVEETGSTSCPGTNNTSKTHATALWTVEQILSAAQQGVERMNMHSMLGACRGGAPMSPICSETGDGLGGTGEILAQPNYMAMQLASISVGGEFLRVAMSGDKDVHAYAVKTSEGRILVTIVNQNDAAKYSSSPVTIEIPDGYARVRAAQISAPENASRSRTKFTGLLPVEKSDGSLSVSQKGLLGIELLASSATVLEFEK